MIKLFCCFRHLHGLSREEFHSHWLEYHSQFWRRVKPLRRYVQYHTLADDPSREVMFQAGLHDVEPFDGVQTLWWDSLDAMHNAMERSPDVAAAREDEKLFIDPNRSVAFVTEEAFVLEPEGSVPYVFMECFRRRPDLDRATFKSAWLDHVGLARQALETELMSGYMQNHALLGDDAGVEGFFSEQEPLDGVAMAYFDSIIKWKALITSPLVSQDSYEHEKTFLDHTQVVYILTRRYVIKDIVR